VISYYIEFLFVKIQVFEDAYKSQFSIIILDDIERYLSPKSELAAMQPLRISFSFNCVLIFLYDLVGYWSM
jgi:hypothetical protein